MNNQLLLPLVTPYSRLCFLVQSSKRKEVEHVVDLEGFDGEEVYCSCEAFTIGMVRPCKHIKNVIKIKNLWS